MTDKDIIDVNKCKYRDTNSNFCLAEKDDIGECYTICTGNDCYYKQLQREEQDNQSLLNVIDDLRDKKNNLEEMYNDLGQECEELKRTISTLEGVNKLFENDLDSSFIKVVRFKQALEKIEKIALRYVEAQGRYEILEIINEVKDE